MYDILKRAAEAEVNSKVALIRLNRCMELLDKIGEAKTVEERQVLIDEYNLIVLVHNMEGRSYDKRYK